MTLESALTYLVALALPLWLVVEQIMICSGRAARQRGPAESAAVPGVDPSGQPSRVRAEAPRDRYARAGQRETRRQAPYGAEMTPAASRSVTRSSS